MSGMTPEEPYDFTATRATPLGAPAAPIDPTNAFPPAYGPPPTPPRKRHTGLIVGIVLSVVVLLGGSIALVFALTGSGVVTIPGVVQQRFDAQGRLEITGGCSGLGYSDIREGTQVVLTDEKQTVLAAASLVSDGTCRYYFLLKGIPTGRSFYGITISHRGTLQMTEAELRAGIMLTL